MAFCHGSGSSRRNSQDLHSLLSSNEAVPSMEMNRCMGPMMRELGGRVNSNIGDDSLVLLRLLLHSLSLNLFFLSHPETSFRAGWAFRLGLPHHL
eukprot:5365934-Pyramimonas_sp.AAC.1